MYMEIHAEGETYTRFMTFHAMYISASHSSTELQLQNEGPGKGQKAKFTCFLQLQANIAN